MRWSPSGPVRISVCEVSLNLHRFREADLRSYVLDFVNRSSKRIANWFIADFQLLAARPQSSVMLRRASQISLVTC